MKYSDDQWIKCRWRIDRVPGDQKCYEEYPELAEIFGPILKAYVSAGEVGVSIDQLIRYVVLTYHRFSPYAVLEQNIIKRKIEVCELIGLNLDKDHIGKMIANRNKFVNNAAIFFLKQDDSMDWVELTQYLEAYYQVMAALTDDSEQDTKKTTQEIANTKLTIVKNLKSIKQEIEQLSVKVFKEDSDLLNFVERYRKAEEENFIVLSPEDYVRSKRATE